MSMMKDELYDRLMGVAAELDCSTDFVLDAYSSLDHFWEIFKFEEMKPEWIEDLSRATGYSVEYLNSLYAECMEEDPENPHHCRETFVIITLERDW